MNAYEVAMRDVRDVRRAALDRGRMIWENALRADDKLYAAFRQYQDQMIKSAKGESNSLGTARAALKAEMDRCGIKQSDIEPPCRCALCNDTGKVNGKYCSCVVKRVINSDKDNLSLPTVDFIKAEKSAPSAPLKKCYKLVREYIDGFPTHAKPFLVLIGQPGTGKTMLAAATATSLMEKGAAVVTVSAFDFVRRALDYHTQFAIDDYVDGFSPMIDCDLLVIDDLGTESMLKNVTREYLYTVINERWLKRKYTIITSNLTPDGIFSRYGESIGSRMIDKSLSTVCLLNSKNKRID